MYLSASMMLVAACLSETRRKVGPPTSGDGLPATKVQPTSSLIHDDVFNVASLHSTARRTTQGGGVDGCTYTGVATQEFSLDNHRPTAKKATSVQVLKHDDVVLMIMLLQVRISLCGITQTCLIRLPLCWMQ